MHLLCRQVAVNSNQIFRQNILKNSQLINLTYSTFKKNRNNALFDPNLISYINKIMNNLFLYRLF